MSGRGARDALVTGIGLVSALADGIEANRAALMGGARPRADRERFAPYPVFPLVEIDLSTQIPRRADQRQMEPWQRIGTYAAGLALDDAGLKGDAARLGETHLIVAAGGGERDPQADAAVLAAVRAGRAPADALNALLPTELRPTLFLSQLSNLLAGNISIVHSVTGSSRTFMGEELSGAMALQVAERRIRASQGDLFLVGASYNAERPDMLLLLELGRFLWKGFGLPSVWARESQGGGLVTGSMGVFLVLESREHADARGARAYAELGLVAAESGPRDDTRLGLRLARMRAALEPHLGRDAPVLAVSGASGAAPATAIERGFLEALGGASPRGVASLLGTGLEAQMPLAVALAAAAVHAGKAFPPLTEDEAPAEAQAPETALATAFGHWRGEAAAVIRRA